MRLGATHAHTIRPTREVSDPRADQGACARNSGPTCEVSNPRANERTHARGEERKQLARARSSFACNSIE